MTIRDDFKAHIDGELGPEQAIAVERLIAIDPEAAAEHAQLRSLGDAVRSMAREPAVVGADRVRFAGRSPWRPWTLAFGGVATVLLLGIVFPFFALGKGGSAVLGNSGVLPTRGPDARAAPEARAPSFAAGSTASPSPADKSRNLSQSKPDESFARGAAKVGSPDSPVLSTETFVDPNRRVIRRADVRVSVDMASEAVAQASRHAAAVGGYVESSSILYAEGRPVGTVTLRVPARAFETTLAAIRGMGTVDTESMSGEDVTAQVADLDARSRTLAAEEQSLITMLRGARRMGEILEIRDRLTSVRSEIESMKSQSAVLKNLSSLSTISATFAQRERAGEDPKPEDWFERTIASAVNALTGVGKVFVQGLVFLIVLSPIWVPVVLGVWWLSRKVRRS